MAHNPIPISRLRHSWGIRLIPYTSTLTVLAAPLIQMANMFTSERARPPFDNQLPGVGRILGEQPDALSSRVALQALLECPWATKGQWKVFPEGKVAATDPSPPPTAETYRQTIRLLAAQQTVYTRLQRETRMVAQD